MALKQTCAKAGCAVAIPFGTRWCERHAATEPKAKQEHERVRHRHSEPTPAKREAARLYASVRWQEMRLAQLRLEPLCRRCASYNRVVAATVVDHVERHGLDLNLFYDRTNLQSLCKPCHDLKTNTEDRRARLAEAD
jgi:5-methylcytosine-specific restriction protein A